MPDHYIIATPQGLALGTLAQQSAALAHRTLPATLVMLLERDGRRYIVAGFSRDGSPIIESRRNATVTA